MSCVYDLRMLTDMSIKHILTRVLFINAHSKYLPLCRHVFCFILVFNQRIKAIILTSCTFV